MRPPDALRANIAFVGCGFVFDIYMRTIWAYPEFSVCGVFDIDRARLNAVCSHYNFNAYSSYEELLADPAVDLVINLTNIGSHYQTIRRALEAGKHVYSEKPFTTDLEKTKDLFALAASQGLVLTGAPCNVFCDSIVTIWHAVRNGAIGKPVLIYAELDDNPVHLMSLDRVQSPTGAHFPYIEELQEGCTVEHVAYHLVWLCALFGPVMSITAFATFLIDNKTSSILSPPDTPDVSVACLTFADGVTARVTCSWVAPRDHSFQIIGDAGALFADNVFHDQTSVRLERFSRVSLTGRKAYSLRTHAILGRLFGIGGRRLSLLRRWKSHAVESERNVRRTLKQKIVSRLRRREVYAQDKMLGIAEMMRALKGGDKQPLGPDFLIHLNEITLLIHNAGKFGMSVTPTTGFRLLEPPPEVLNTRNNYLEHCKPSFLERLLLGTAEQAHRR